MVNIQQSVPVRKFSGERYSTKMKELYLDTKGTCFLCLREFSNSRDNKEGMPNFCFRNICKYLDINPLVTFLNSLKGLPLAEREKEDASLQKEKCDFSVLLCVTCLFLTNKLTEIICQMEIVTTQMTHQLQLFQAILLASEQQSEPHCLWKILEEKMTSTCGSPAEVTLVENLRHTTKQKCKKYRRMSSCTLNINYKYMNIISDCSFFCLIFTFFAI